MDALAANYNNVSDLMMGIQKHIQRDRIKFHGQKCLIFISKVIDHNKKSRYLNRAGNILELIKILLEHFDVSQNLKDIFERLA